MQPFTKLTGIAAPLPMVNVDTDKIIPARFAKTIGCCTDLPWRWAGP
jgi:3-isopropylmalate/(R)-2-methylmalate dehydratase small subunit